jgi:hypothetical protein
MSKVYEHFLEFVKPFRERFEGPVNKLVVKQLKNGCVEVTAVYGVGPHATGITAVCSPSMILLNNERYWEIALNWMGLFRT